MLKEVIFAAMSFVTVNAFALQVCEPLANKAVVLVQPNEKIEVSYAAAGGNALTRSQYGNAMGQKAVLGLTRADYAVDLSFGLATSPASLPEQQCYSPALTVSVGFKPFEVYIAQELENTSCAKDYVTAHENIHVEIYKQALPDFVKSVKSALDSALPRGVLARTPNEARAAFGPILQDVISTTMTSLMTELQVKQLDHDDHHTAHAHEHACLTEYREVLAELVATR